MWYYNTVVCWEEIKMAKGHKGEHSVVLCILDTESDQCAKIIYPERTKEEAETILKSAKQTWEEIFLNSKIIKETYVEK